MAANTKQVIGDTFREMLQTIPLNKLTVSDIAQRCGVSRMTFYYYFEDIYDLIRWICQEEGSRVIGSCLHYENWAESLRAVCQAVLENRGLVESIYRSVQHDQIEAYLYRVMHHLISGVVREHTQKDDIPQEEQEKITDFFALAFVGVAIKWVKGGFQESPEELSRWLSIIINGQIDLAVRNYRVGLGTI